MKLVTEYVIFEPRACDDNIRAKHCEITTQQNGVIRQRYQASDGPADPSLQTMFQDSEVPAPEQGLAPAGPDEERGQVH